MKTKYTATLGDEGLMFLGHIKDGATRLNGMVKGLLEYSRIGQHAAPTQCDTGKIVQTVCTSLTRIIDEADARIEIGMLPTIEAYERELSSLIMNLITNAIKFRKKTKPIKVRISAERAGCFWKFSVADNGIGIPKAKHKEIFKMFQRLHTREKYSGMGIGLAQCAKIAELHGGELWVESKPNVGSTFIFTAKI